ncbi:MAG: hypothetical protein ACK53T_07840 [Planctomycetota bacterium]|jgi:hypothetical protein
MKLKSEEIKKVKYSKDELVKLFCKEFSYFNVNSNIIRGVKFNSANGFYDFVKKKTFTLEELNYYRSLLDFHYRLNIPITAVAKVHNHIEKISWRLVQLTEKKIFDSMRSCDYTEEQINKIKKYVTNKD